MGEVGLSGWRNKILCSKKKLKSEIWGKGACDIWEKWACLGGDIKYSAPEKELKSEIWGKGVCDIWEKWVLCEKKN